MNFSFLPSFNKQSKRIALSLLFFCLSLVLTVPSSLALSDRFPFFEDIEPTHHQFSAITYLLQNDIITGYNDGTFKPTQSVSRAEALKILLEGSNTSIKTPGENPFADVGKNEWFAKYVYTAQRKQIVSGDGETGLFMPSRTINKAEAVKMILEINNVSIRSVRAGEDWFIPYFEKAISLRIIKDQNNAEYTLTRGDLASLMYVYIHKDNLEIIAVQNPEKLEVFYANGLFHATWNQPIYKEFQVVATQGNKTKESAIIADSSLITTQEFWKGFSEGSVKISLYGRKINAAKFDTISSKNIPVFERFTPFFSADITQNTIDWEYDSAITISLLSNETIKNPKGYVLNTDEELFEKVLVQNGNSISFSFTPQQKDFYILEVTNAIGLAKAILPIVPRGYFPILPNDLDLLSAQSEYNESDFLKRINTFRQNNGRTTLGTTQSLSALAQVRMKDMQQQNYFSHYSPDGKTIEDLRSDFSINSGVLENISSNSKSSMHALIGLEYSPTHRSALLREDISFVGISSLQFKNGQYGIVEVFQKTPLSQNDVDVSTSDIRLFITQEYSKSINQVRVQKAALEWSEKMAINQEVNTEFDDGQQWENVLDDNGINGNTGILVISHSSPKGILEYLNHQEKALDQLFSQKPYYGLSLSLSQEGLIYLCIITTDEQ